MGLPEIIAFMDKFILKKCRFVHQSKSIGKY